MPEESRSKHIAELAKELLEDIELNRMSAKRDGQVFSYNPQQFLSGSLLRFILLPFALATRSSKPHPGSCHQDPGVDALCYIDQRIS